MSVCLHLHYLGFSFSLFAWKWQKLVVLVVMYLCGFFRISGFLYFRGIIRDKHVPTVLRCLDVQITLRFNLFESYINIAFLR